MDVKVDATAVKDLMTRIAGAPYEVSEPPKGFAHKVRWFVWAPDLYYADRTAHVWAVWLDEKNLVNFQSAHFDDVIELVLRTYGEEGAGKAMAIDYGKAAEKIVRTRLTKGFPLVRQALHKYDEIISKVSRKTGVKLRLLFDGENGVAWFKLGTSLLASPNLTVKEEGIESVVAALREAFDLLGKTET